jgi:NADH-quinone oxidoreductase E subunit
VGCGDRTEVIEYEEALLLRSRECPHCDPSSKDVREVIREFDADRGNLIPILHAVQDQFGYLTSAAMEEVADWLSIPASEVYGTATFYTLFATKPVGQHVIRLCDSTPCHIEGSKSIKETLEANLGICTGETTKDGLFTLEVVSCFGLCGVAPAIMIDEDVYGNLTPESIPQILDKYRKEGA